MNALKYDAAVQSIARRLPKQYYKQLFLLAYSLFPVTGPDGC